MQLPQRRMVLLGVIMLLLGGWVFQAASFAPVSAQIPNQTEQARDQESAPRVTRLTVPFTKYKWWVIRWSNNAIQCSVWVEHEGFPTLNEVETQCGQRVAEDWADTQPCNFSLVTSTSQCPGVYLLQVDSRTEERQIEVELPKPQVYLSIENCNSPPGDTRCTSRPNLVLTGDEPLPNETIISIQGTMNGVPFSCMGSQCSLPLQPTGMDGALIQFWGDSSFGDSTEHFTARVRLIPWGGFMNPEEPRSTEVVRYYVDVLSAQWRGGELASCSETWEVFPGYRRPAFLADLTEDDQRACNQISLTTTWPARSSPTGWSMPAPAWMAACKRRTSPARAAWKRPARSWLSGKTALITRLCRPRPTPAFPPAC
jgi:hypothetical protein